MPVAVLSSEYAARWERSFIKDHGLQPIRILTYNLFSEFLSVFFFLAAKFLYWRKYCFSCKVYKLFFNLLPTAVSSFWNIL